MRNFIASCHAFLTAKNRFWVPLLFGIAYCLGVPPVNGFLHPALSLFPLLGFFICLPLFGFSSLQSIKRSALYCVLFGMAASAGQFYWIAFVVPEGLWPLILVGVVLITIYESVYFLVLGLGFRFLRGKFPKAYPFLFAALWVMVEYLRSLGEISFPWNFAGYTLTPFLWLAQAASVCGVFGLSYIVILGNGLIWKFCGHIVRKQKISWGLPVFVCFLIVISIAGALRMHKGTTDATKNIKVSVLQGNIDQNHWTNTSLDSSFMIFDTLVARAHNDNPDLLVMPESALLCYLLRQPALRRHVVGWSLETKTPMILGSLHWDYSQKGSKPDYAVYNTALFLDTARPVFEKYYKMTLVPFSEVLPFKGIFPVLSRVNLGQADFASGKDPVVFSIGQKIKAAPFICYEIIYPSIVRQRILRGANLLVNITNDGWFGKSSGAYQHAAMARMRCIENGVCLARSANSGFSMFVDQYGRILGKTDLYTRTFLTRAVSLDKKPTLYSKFGDWPVLLSALLCAVALIAILIRKSRRS